MKPKIYFAKSNQASPDHVMMVREMLSKCDVDIVEYKGGSYSHKPMLECDYLFILPNMENYEEDEEVVGVGKGLHQQIDTWFEDKGYDNVFMITYPTNSTSYQLRVVDHLDISDEDDYVNYSVAILQSESFGMVSYTLSTFGLATNKTSNNKMYVLIKN